MPDATHWVGCWRVHHDCAIAIIERIVDGVIAEAEEAGATADAVVAVTRGRQSAHSDGSDDV